MQAGNFFVQVFWQDVDLIAILLRLVPEFHLRQHLVAKGIGHHETRMAGRAAKIHQAAFRKQNDALAIRENYVVDLRLDVVPLVLL